MILGKAFLDTRITSSVQCCRNHINATTQQANENQRHLVVVKEKKQSRFLVYPDSRKASSSSKERKTKIKRRTMTQELAELANILVKLGGGNTGYAQPNQQHANGHVPPPQLVDDCHNNQDRSSSSLVMSTSTSLQDWFPRELRQWLDHYDLDSATSSASSSSSSSTASILSWLPQGMIWRIHNVRDFSRHILPRWHRFAQEYNNNMLSSQPLACFLACCTALNFRVVSQGENSIAFYHEVSCMFGRFMFFH